MTYLLLNFLELALITITKLFYPNIYFNTSFGLFFYTVLSLYFWHTLLNIPWCKGDTTCLMVSSFCMYSLSCIITAWWWSKLGAETSHRKINIFIKGCWLWLEILLSLIDWYASEGVPYKVFSGIARFRPV
jgi:hypothetical protein